MNTMRRLLVMYAPLLFLTVLAAVSFVLSPGEAPPLPLAYTATLQQAHYARLEPGRMLRVSAARVEQETPSRAQLHDLHLRQDGDNGSIVLAGKSGTVMLSGGHPKFVIAQVRGVVENDGQLLTLRAVNAVYDSGIGVLSGDRPQLQNSVIRLSGERFVWSAADGLKVQGRVRSVYHR